MAQEHQTSDAETAALFKALGDPTRLRIFRFLRGCCGPVAVEDDGSVRPVEGPTVGEVCCHITGQERITSTISEHLKDLRTAGLIVMERRGRNMLCTINPDAVKTVTDFFTLVEPATNTEPKDTNGGCC